MNGVLGLDKPQELSSFQACAIVRGLLGGAKTGHGGTLDPMATGVLPVLIGRATRAMDLIPHDTKRYTATMRFGYTSDTLDIWGAVTPTHKPLPSASAAKAALAAFVGETMQIPPMTSALQKNGVRLYELARQGIEVEREARPIRIERLDFLSFDEAAGEMTVDCVCSRGTYIRSLCDDIGKALGCGAVMTALRRTSSAGIDIADCLTLDKVRELAAEGKLEAALRPTDTLFTMYPSVTVTEPQARRFQNGGALSLSRLTVPITGTTRVYAPNGAFLGLGEPKEDELKIVRLLGGMDE